MDLQQQVKNSLATIEHMRKTKVRALPCRLTGPHSSLVVKMQPVMQPLPGLESCSFAEHHKALQGLSNGSKLPYSRTLRVVQVSDYLTTPLVLLIRPLSVPVTGWHASLLQHKVTKFPKIETSQARHAPGYIRGELGGVFTS